MRREEEFNNVTNKLLKDPALLMSGNALNNFYLGYIAVSLAIIADELHEMNEEKQERSKGNECNDSACVD